MNYLREVTIRRERQPIIYKKINGRFCCYDGFSYGFLDREQFNEMQKITSDFVFIKKEKKDKKEKRSMKEIYDTFVHDANFIKEKTNGIINMYKTGRDSITAMYLAYYFLNKNNIVPEEITYQEYEWLENAKHGALVFCQEKYCGPIFKYDYNSNYASVYSSNNFLIPIQQGEFKTISNDEFEALKYYQIGVYHVEIQYPDNNYKKWKKLFRLNHKNYYTQIDLTLAKELNLPMTIIIDSQPNFLFYDRNKCKTGKQCFGQFVDYLYPLKLMPEIRGRIKSFLNCLWGALGYERKYTIKQSKGKHITIFDNKKIKSICPDQYGNWDHMIITTINKDHCPYTSNWARIKPFILAKCRSKLIKQILPYHEHIRRSHTDSMLSDIPLPIKTSSELGEFKYEGFCPTCEIVNNNTVKGQFITDLEHEKYSNDHQYILLINDYLSKQNELFEQSIL